MDTVDVLLYGCDHCGHVQMIKTIDAVPTRQCDLCLIGERRLITFALDASGRVKLEITCVTFR